MPDTGDCCSPFSRKGKRPGKRPWERGSDSPIIFPVLPATVSLTLKSQHKVACTDPHTLPGNLKSQSLKLGTPRVRLIEVEDKL